MGVIVLNIPGILHICVVKNHPPKAIEREEGGVDKMKKLLTRSHLWVYAVCCYSVLSCYILTFTSFGEDKNARLNVCVKIVSIINYLLCMMKYW